MPEVSGLELLAQLKAENPHRPVILITAHASVDIAVDAIKEGAQDFLTKPLDYSKLRAILDAAQIEVRQVEGSQELRIPAGRWIGCDGTTSFIGVSSGCPGDLETGRCGGRQGYTRLRPR